MIFKKTLIYIDDSEIDHQIMKIMQQEYQVFDSISHNLDGKSVIQHLKQNCHAPNQLPDVILVDLYMKSYSGWEFLKDMNDLMPYLIKNIVVYILSSSIHPVDLSRAAEYPFVQDYLVKPLTKGMMVQI